MKRITQNEYSEISGINRWRIVKVISMLKCNLPITFIAKSQKISIKRVLDIEVSFVKNTKKIETVQGLKITSYHVDENEMIIQDYNGSDLTGWELEVFNSKN